MPDSSAPRIAVVTGAGSGIGRAVAVALLADGWSVALLGRREEPLRETLEMGPSGCTGLVLPTDVTDPAEVRAAFAAVETRFARVDLLFNNAGMFGRPTPIEHLDPAAWDAVIAVNVNGAFYCAQAAYDLMLRQEPKGGRIVNNGSLSAHVPRPHAIAYTTSKHAITGLTKAIALEGRAHGIACGQIDIGNAATELTSGIMTSSLQADGQMRPEPSMDVAHVADAVRYLADLPLDVNVLSLTVMANQMPFVGRG